MQSFTILLFHFDLVFFFSVFLAMEDSMSFTYPWIVSVLNDLKDVT